VDYGGGGGDGKTLISPPHFSGSGRPERHRSIWKSERKRPNAANLPI
jgi:hypothetical protein